MTYAYCCWNMPAEVGSQDRAEEKHTKIIQDVLSLLLIFSLSFNNFCIFFFFGKILDFESFDIKYLCVLKETYNMKII